MSYLEQFYHLLYGPEAGRKWVFVHGLMGYAQNWRKIISAFEPTERCLAYDQRGHGRSIKPENSYAPKDYADDLFHILSELGWKQIVLVGHSMGGRNVLNFANRYPDLISHLVIEDIGPDGNPHAHEYYENLLNMVPTPFENRQAAKDYFFGEFKRTAKTRENIQVMANYFYANVEEKADSSVDWRFSKKAMIDSVRLGRSGDVWNEIQGLKVPTLYVRGELSKELSRENFEKVLASNPMIKGVEIPSAGHWVHSDQPQAFIGALKQFVGNF
jgi:esterase